MRQREVTPHGTDLRTQYLAFCQRSKKRLFLTGFFPSKKIGMPSHPQNEPVDLCIACI